jgi:hypothetical protein
MTYYNIGNQTWAFKHELDPWISGDSLPEFTEQGTVVSLDIYLCDDINTLIIPQSVRTIRIVDCPQLRLIQTHTMIQYLHLTNCPLLDIPITSVELPRLIYLNLTTCKNIKHIKFELDSVILVNLTSQKNMTMVAIQNGMLDIDDCIIDQISAIEQVVKITNSNIDTIAVDKLTLCIIENSLINKLSISFFIEELRFDYKNLKSIEFAEFAFIRNTRFQPPPEPNVQLMEVKVMTDIFTQKLKQHRTVNQMVFHPPLSFDTKYLGRKYRQTKKALNVRKELPLDVSRNIFQYTKDYQMMEEHHKNKMADQRAADGASVFDSYEVSSDESIDGAANGSAANGSAANGSAEEAANEAADGVADRKQKRSKFGGKRRTQKMRFKKRKIQSRKKKKLDRVRRKD